MRSGSGTASGCSTSSRTGWSGPSTSGAPRTIERLGGKAVFVGRFTAALRALVPGVAGMSGMTYRTFLPWNVLGGATWAAGFVVLGYLAGSQYKRIEHYANYVGLALLAAVAVWLYVRHRRAAARESAQPPA